MGSDQGMLRKENGLPVPNLLRYFMGLLQAEIASPPSIASQCLRHLQTQRAAHILLPVHLLPVIIFPLCHLPSQGILNEESPACPTGSQQHPLTPPCSLAAGFPGEQVAQHRSPSSARSHYDAKPNIRRTSERAQHFVRETPISAPSRPC